MRLPAWQREGIEREVAHLLRDYDLTEYPLDMFDVAKHMGVTVVAYSTLLESIRELALSCSEEGFTVRDKDRGFVIYYNDSRNHNRVAFTIAHEIAHIWLDHRDGTPIEEAQANYFAGYILSPHPLLRSVLKKHGYIGALVAFGTSSDCISISIQQMYQRNPAAKPPRGHETWILNNCRLNGSKVRQLNAHCPTNLQRKTA